MVIELILVLPTMIIKIPRRRQNVPMRAFYVYLIHEREYGEDTVTKGGRLYQ